jgi:hypothetical protein
MIFITPDRITGENHSKNLCDAQKFDSSATLTASPRADTEIKFKPDHYPSPLNKDRQ